METWLRTGKCFYSTCLSPELHPILPNLINSTPGSSLNFHQNFLLKDIQNFIFSLREVGTKKAMTFVTAQQYAATKPDSLFKHTDKEDVF